MSTPKQCECEHEVDTCEDVTLKDVVSDIVSIMGDCEELQKEVKTKMFGGDTVNDTALITTEAKSANSIMMVLQIAKDHLSDLRTELEDLTARIG